MADKITLKTLLGDYKNAMALKTGEVSSPLVDFQFADVKVPNTAFKRLVRDKEFDFGELAIVTYLQAKSFGTPYVLLPATVVGRGQHHTIAYNPENGPLRPQDLNGKRVGAPRLFRHHHDLGARHPGAGLRGRPRQREMGDVRGSARGRIQGSAHRYPCCRRQGDRQDAARRRARRRGGGRQAAGSAPEAL